MARNRNNCYVHVFSFFHEANLFLIYANERLKQCEGRYAVLVPGWIDTEILEIWNLKCEKMLVTSSLKCDDLLLFC